MTPLDERLGPDLLRGRGRSIGGDLDVGKEGSVGYQHACTQVGLANKAYLCKCNQEHKQEQ
jgi:hypothetical protein